MRGVVCYGDNKLQMEEVPTPKASPGHVLVDVKASGICGTDRAVLAGDGPPWMVYPIIPGHEVSGVVCEVGQDAAEFTVGDGVAIDNYLHCGICWYCKNGHYYHCDSHTEVGMTINGGFAEYCLVPKTNLVKLPEGLSVHDAVLTEPTATALRACRDARICFEEVVVVLGCGALGVLIAQIAKRMGGVVILVGRGPRLNRVAKMGLDAVVDSSKCDWSTAVKGLIGETPVSVLFEVTGSAGLLNASVSLMKKMGRLVLMGLTGGVPSELPADDVVIKEIEVLGKVSGMGYLEEAAKLLASKTIDPSLNITHTFPLEQYEEALRYERERLDGAIKVVLTQ